MRVTRHVRIHWYCVAALLVATGAYARGSAGCPAGVDPSAEKALGQGTETAGCKTRMSHGFPLPDPACTPGAINPTVTISVLKSGSFKTPCVRDQQSSPAQKGKTYAAYGIKKPSGNTGQHQTCELDHLVSLELGGGDDIDNIWPQCGPKGKPLNSRFFKIKDGVENFLAAQVRSGAMSLDTAQKDIAEDWTQFIADAHAAHGSGSGFGSDQTPPTKHRKKKT